MVTVQVGGVDFKIFIDSGANSNIIDEGTWEQLEVKRVKCESQAPSPDKKLYLYASSQPLPVQGSFKCTVSVCDRSTKAEVLVIKGRGMSLLGKITATELGVLKVGINIAMVTSKADSLKQQYPYLRVSENSKQTDISGYIPHCKTYCTALQNDTI